MNPTYICCTNFWCFSGSLWSPWLCCTTSSSWWVAPFSGRSIRVRLPFGTHWIICAILSICWIHWSTCMKVRSTTRRWHWLTDCRTGTAASERQRERAAYANEIWDILGLTKLRRRQWMGKAIWSHCNMHTQTCHMCVGGV